MGKIRINDLARELEVKSKLVLEYLPEIGITDKHSHSSALEDEIADKVRAHFRAASGEEAAQEEAPAPAPAPEAVGTSTPPTHVEAKKIVEIKPDLHPLTRTIAEIKAAARKAVVAPPPPPPPPKPAPTVRPAEKLAP